jgi:hypothetical protein
MSFCSFTAPTNKMLNFSYWIANPNPRNLFVCFFLQTMRFLKNKWDGGYITRNFYDSRSSKLHQDFLEVQLLNYLHPAFTDHSHELQTFPVK